MRKFLFIILILASLNIYGQKFEIEGLINRIATKEVPANFEYYFLVSESLEQPKIYDSLKNYQIRELRIFDKNFPLYLIHKHTKEVTDWKKYDLKNAKYVFDEYNYQTTSPPMSKTVQFVNYTIDKSEYDSLIKNKKPYTLVIKKKWLWSKKRVRKEIVKAWKKDEKQNLEEKIYFQFSKPIFSEDKKYAKVSVFRNRRCKGYGFTALYKNDNGSWIKLIEYNQRSLLISTTHISCGDIIVNYN